MATTTIKVFLRVTAHFFFSFLESRPRFALDRSEAKKCSAAKMTTKSSAQQTHAETKRRAGGKSKRVPRRERHSLLRERKAFMRAPAWLGASRREREREREPRETRALISWVKIPFFFQSHRDPTKKKCTCLGFLIGFHRQTTSILHSRLLKRC